MFEYNVYHIIHYIVSIFVCVYRYGAVLYTTTLW